MSQEINPEFMPPSGQTYSQILYGLESVEESYTLHRAQMANKIIGEITEVREAIKDIPGFLGCLGLGYPFYAMDGENGPLEVPAINEYLDESKMVAGVSAELYGPSWPCVDCQIVNKLPDLKSQCNPCDRTLYKPRDLFETLPDIDVIGLFEHATAETERDVQAVLGGLGLIQSDNDIRGSYNRTVGSVMGLAAPAAKLPVDAHIWDKKKFLEACEEVQRTPDSGEVPIVSRSLHSEWEDHTINFWFDFVFSLTEVGEIDPSLQETISKTRKALIMDVGANQMLSVIRKVSRRGKTILESKKMSNVMKAKFEAWQSN